MIKKEEQKEGGGERGGRIKRSTNRIRFLNFF
jgi:hypothetical protein